jgi:hypothetical protein
MYSTVWRTLRNKQIKLKLWRDLHLHTGPKFGQQERKQQLKLRKWNSQGINKQETLKLGKNWTSLMQIITLWNQSTVELSCVTNGRETDSQENSNMQLSRSSAQYITSQQDRGSGRHLLVGVVLQASQVEVGISRKETGNNAGPIRESQTGSGSESETGVGYGIRDIRSNSSDQTRGSWLEKDAQAQWN